MIRAFFTVAGPVKLLPHFLDHYTRCGVEQFVFCAYEPSVERYSHLLAHVVQHCLDNNVLFEKGFCFRDCCMDWRHRALAITKIVKKRGWLDDWILYPDLDEFVHVPGRNLRNYFDRTHGSVQVVTGLLRDRVTRDGKLVEVRSDVPLGEQFPCTARVTSSIAENSQKQIEIIVACKGVAPTTHRPDAGTTKGLKKTPKPLHVDHFKWNADCLEHMRKRQAYYEEIKMPNRGQSKQLTTHILKHGRIKVEMPKLKLRRINRETVNG